MQITLTMELTDENLKKLSLFLNDGATFVDIKEAPATAPEQKPEPKKAKPPVKEETPAITKNDLMAVALKISKANKTEELAAIFKDFGAEKLSQIEEKDYAAVMERMGEINA